MQAPLHTTTLLRFSLLLLALLCALPRVSAAQESHPARVETTPPHGSHGDAAEAHEFHRNHLGVFLGGTTLQEQSGFTLGGDYERRFHRNLGVGIQAEHAFGTVKDTVVVFPVFFHPGTNGLRLAAGPGFSRENEEEPGREGGVSPGTRKVTEFLWRFQILYDFEVGERVTITPNIALDFVNGRQFFVYGVTLGTGF